VFVATFSSCENRDAKVIGLVKTSKFFLIIFTQLFFFMAYTFFLVGLYKKDLWI